MFLFVSLRSVPFNETSCPSTSFQNCTSTFTFVAFEFCAAVLSIKKVSPFISNCNLHLKLDLRLFNIADALNALLHLSNAQNDTASKIDDLPLAFGANNPITPFNFVKSITLSSPYENIFENSNLIGFHTMFLAKSSSVSLLFNSVFNDLTFARL